MTRSPDFVLLQKNTASTITAEPRAFRTSTSDFGIITTRNMSQVNPFPNEEIPNMCNSSANMVISMSQVNVPNQPVRQKKVNEICKVLIINLILYYYVTNESVKFVTPELDCCKAKTVNVRLPGI